jgi:hypothetical protein
MQTTIFRPLRFRSSYSLTNHTTRFLPTMPPRSSSASPTSPYLTPRRPSSSSSPTIHPYTSPQIRPSPKHHNSLESVSAFHLDLNEEPEEIALEGETESAEGGEEGGGGQRTHWKGQEVVRVEGVRHVDVELEAK